MPSQNAATWLELPALEGLSAAATAALNDRLRTIAAQLDSATQGGGVTSGSGGGSGSAPTTGGGLSGAELVLSVPGTLGVRTNAAPLVSLASSGTPSAIVGMLKQLPQGASVVVNLLVAGAVYTTLSLPAGSSAPVVLTGPLGGAIAANALITLNVLQVGTTFPGSDLSVLLRF